MTRKPLLRALAGVLALATGFAGPGTALVHGLQHQDPGSTGRHTVSATAHVHDHDDEPHAPQSSNSPDHPHPRLDSGTTTRTTVDVSPVLVPAVVVWAPAVAVGVVEELQGEALSVVLTATGPPPPSRAPPSI